MVTVKQPDFMEWVEVTEEGWKLKDNAPKDIEEKYNKWVKWHESLSEIKLEGNE